MPDSENWFDAINTFLYYEHIQVFKLVNYNIILGLLLQVFIVFGVAFVQNGSDYLYNFLDNINVFHNFMGLY